MDISNGEGLGVALFVQGCHFHCKNCFNKETWDFNGGKEFTMINALELLSPLYRPQYSRLSILGGEPLEPDNILELTALCKFVKTYMPDKKIWLYTGHQIGSQIDFEDLIIFKYVDVVVDGQYQDELKDMSYPWAGSANQRVIDVQKSLKSDNGEIVLWQSSN